MVRAAFGISAQTASRLSGCLEYDPNPYLRQTVEEIDAAGRAHLLMRDHNRNRRNPARRKRYENVGREFEALGVEEFAHRYLTERDMRRIIA